MTDWRDVAAALNRLPRGELVAAMDRAWPTPYEMPGTYAHVVGDVHPYLRFPMQRKG